MRVNSLSIMVHGRVHDYACHCHYIWKHGYGVVGHWTLSFHRSVKVVGSVLLSYGIVVCSLVINSDFGVACYLFD